MSETVTDRRPQVAASTIRMEGAPRTAPLSPHLSIWRWTPVNLTSILHRATGIANAAGATLLAAWFASGAIGEGAYEAVSGVLGSPLGLLVLILFTWSVMYHMTNGVRHLIWDSGHMLGKAQRGVSAYTVYGLSVLFTALIWIAAFAMGGN
ncbi:succinate dehydrogenase, cytochrome b556 subunit [Parvularcula dongshanensis]|uniref:Succinate dehydrogenase cytochrome b556 subunit n=1 Tax=Parvularcula dongshanensis TaxID=1173995 RepID=A0A840HZV6_9PROT|nr:succinate dehydrogenase, cytochrome b556 subunit [Parvularcula dongshanensis]MBB4658109.1 succinate dehydrogenase / fumarate reductase cytochrome b subunit [Parvularcula dongshanensis]